jgi:hypothetical protein
MKIAMIISAAVLATSLGACGSSSNNGNPETSTDAGASDGSMMDGGGTPDVSQGDASGTDGPGTVQEGGGVDGGPGDGGATDSGQGDGGGDAGSCLGPMGCYACTPTTNDEFLNACNGMTCQAFDDQGRLPLLQPDGGLPPLP